MNAISQLSKQNSAKLKALDRALANLPDLSYCVATLVQKISTYFYIEVLVVPGKIFSCYAHDCSSNVRMRAQRKTFFLGTLHPE